MPKTLPTSKQRVVHAPPPTLPSSAALSPKRVLSVVLKPNEDVEWIWTSTSDGATYVSGYTIVKRKMLIGCIARAGLVHGANPLEPIIEHGLLWSSS